MKCSLSRTRSSSKLRSQGGFSFAEVLAAMIFMAILLPVVMQGLILANRASVVAERKRTAARLGNSMLTEIIATDQWRYAGTSGNFGSDAPGYEWELVQGGWPQDDMEQLTLIVKYPVQGAIHQVRLSTLVDDAQE